MAVRVLARMADTRAVEPLIEALKDMSVTKEAGDALGRMSDPGAAYWIAQKLCERCVEIGDSRAVKPLVAALNDRSSGSRQAF